MVTQNYVVSHFWVNYSFNFVKNLKGQFTQYFHLTSLEEKVSVHFRCTFLLKDKVGNGFLGAPPRPQTQPHKSCDTINMRLSHEIISLLSQETQANNNQLPSPCFQTRRCFPALQTHFPKFNIPAFMQNLISLNFLKPHSWETRDERDR